MHNDKTSDQIKHDIHRTIIGNKDFLIDHKTGKNPLYNVLNAISMYDRELDYV